MTKSGTPGERAARLDIGTVAAVLASLGLMVSGGLFYLKSVRALFEFAAHSDKWIR